MQIPNPEHPAKGLLEITLHPGDDLEIDCAAFWGIHPQDQYSPEVSVDDGTGFLPFPEYDAKYKQLESAGSNSRLARKRIGRYRLQRGVTQAVTFHYLVNHFPEPDTTPVPLPPPQQFETISVEIQKLERLKGGPVVTTIAFRNTDAKISSAIAIHNRFSFGDYPMVSLIAANGREYTCVNHAGIQTVYSNPYKLTEVGPRETQVVTLGWNQTWGPEYPASPLKLQIEFVLNANYSRNSYPPDYRAPADMLPKGCRLHNAVFSIPIKIP
jgi:hypothetical protein